MRAIHMIAVTLLWIGGINWLLSVWGWDVMGWFEAGAWMTIVKIVYVLVGLAAIYDIFTHSKHCRMCKPNSGSAM